MPRAIWTLRRSIRKAQQITRSALSLNSILQGGAEYEVNSKYTLFVDFKEVWLSVNAHGVLDDGTDVKARVKLNPEKGQPPGGDFIERCKIMRNTSPYVIHQPTRREYSCVTPK
jgi:hypothetical protein